MYRNVSGWIAPHIEEINIAFGIDLKAMSKEDLARCADVLDVYESKEDFNNDFDVYDKKGQHFELFAEEGFAVELDGKFVYFNECCY